MNNLRTITFLRHAKSDWNCGGLNDHDRPLNQRGRRVAPLVGKYILNQHIPVDVVLSSTAVRAQQTLELVLDQWTTQLRPDIYLTPNLYLASPQKIIAEVGKLNDQWMSVLVIGHNPGLAELCSLLSGRPIEFPTACLASFRFAASHWQQISKENLRPTEQTHYCQPRTLE